MISRMVENNLKIHWSNFSSNLCFTWIPCPQNTISSLHDKRTIPKIIETEIHFALCDFRAGVRSICILVPVLGVTWLFGLLSVNDDVIAFQYIFSILNSVQVKLDSYNIASSYWIDIIPRRRGINSDICFEGTFHFHHQMHFSQKGKNMYTKREILSKVFHSMYKS